MRKFIITLMIMALLMPTSAFADDTTAAPAT